MREKPKAKPTSPDLVKLGAPGEGLPPTASAFKTPGPGGVFACSVLLFNAHCVALMTELGQGSESYNV